MRPIEPHSNLCILEIFCIRIETKTPRMSVQTTIARCYRTTQDSRADFHASSGTVPLFELHGTVRVVYVTVFRIRMSKIVERII
jgi:hypothetical protein